MDVQISSRCWKINGNTSVQAHFIIEKYSLSVQAYLLQNVLTTKKALSHILECTLRAHSFGPVMEQTPCAYPWGSPLDSRSPFLLIPLILVDSWNSLFGLMFGAYTFGLFLGLTLGTHF